MPLQHPATHGSFRKVDLNNTPPETARFLIDVGASEGDPDIQAIEFGALPGVTGSGQANTLTSVGTGSGTQSLVQGKVGVDLQVRGLASLAAPLAVALDAANKRLTLDLTIGTGADELAAGDHDHDGTYAAAGHDHDADYAAAGHDHDADYAAAGHDHDGQYQPAGAYITAAGVTFASLDANGNVGTGASQVAAGDHTHAPADAGLGNVPNLKVNLAATAAPTAGDDSADGYAVGSEWINVTTDKAYKCVDATEAAAVWIETTQSAAGASPGGADTQVQFNDAGAYGGDAGLTYNKTTDTLSLAGALKSDTVAEYTGGAGVTVDGLLIKDGLADGRNLAADGAKLDGMEAGATADQTASEIVAALDAHLGGTAWKDGDVALDVDQANYAITLFGGEAAFVESGLTGVYCTHGTASFPNRIGDDTNTIGGTAYDGGHVGDPFYKIADGNYVVGFPDYCYVVGGYDNLLNQQGAASLGGNHNTIAYPVDGGDGHSYCVGGTYHLINSSRSVIVGGTASAILDDCAGSTIIGGIECLIDDSNRALVGGKNVTVGAGCSNIIAWGLNLEIPASRPDSFFFGQYMGAETARVAATWAQAMENTESRTGGAVAGHHMFYATTTGGSATNMTYQPTALPSGTVFGMALKATVIALKDGSTNGDDDGVFRASMWTGETAYFWDQGDNQGQMNGSVSSGPTHNLGLVGTDNIGSMGTPQIKTNTGVLRLAVTGKAATTVRWTAKLEFVQTACLAAHS